MSRFWTELVADVADHVPGGVAGLAALLLLLAAAVTVALYWRPRRRHPRRDTDPGTHTTLPLPDDGPDDDELPDVPAADLRSLADRYAAAGRYAEAVRERLRAMVRELVDRAVLVHRPGWTVTELAAAAGSAEPGIVGPMGEAAAVFSALWYGGEHATAGHDARMRELADAVHRTVGAVR
ncbi:DUF4129 domain-containing protein [Actinocatenispora rupis]|uniref:Protein-glutamine gamma-glutamyltransferase-like C-terminal domain-containing protein n=1 Tax=Actinocatenispora rupis TaxID=519421 RepID=A0A8J3J2Z6_9ACTN|nr:DUF4129 domain-containing protein [Actinocatenispora rupis]GID10636.1 hypothetical protein Aru02nite_15250 [Actinocatenispora rupis]